MLGRDSFHIGSAFAREASPIVRRQTTQLTFGDAFRNVLVAEARQSNRVATNLLTVQQQIGLMRYHGLMGYWRQRQGALQAAGNAPTPSSSDAEMSTAANDKSSEKENVAQVAFMITTAMRKELSENLSYTAENIKSLTPVDASLILHHQLKPEEIEEKLPGLLEAHRAEQERIAKLEEERQQEQQAKEAAEALAARQASVVPSSEQLKASDREGELKDGLPTIEPVSAEPSSQAEPNEGLYKLDDSSKPAYTLETPLNHKDESAVVGDGSVNSNGGEAPLGSFVESMEEKADTKREWFEIVETRTEDNTQTAVALFSNLKEAEMAMDLKRTFAERRAKEKLDNKDNLPETTYTIQKTIK